MGRLAHRRKKHDYTSEETPRLVRAQRERRFDRRNRDFFAQFHLFLTPDLPLPEIPIEASYRPAHFSLEHLQDLCNKATAIYCMSNRRNDFEGMYKYIREKWTYSDIHTTDIEFARFFGKLIDVPNGTTADTIIRLHETLCGASRIAHNNGFIEEDNFYNHRDHLFNSNLQLEFFKIKPLFRALVMIIDKPLPPENVNFDEQLVRLLRTGFTDGLSQPISFEYFGNQQADNQGEINTTLPEAVKFVMDLDRREESLTEQRDMSVLDEWLESPERVIKRTFIPRGMWTAEKFPTGPSTDWWDNKRKEV